MRLKKQIGLLTRFSLFFLMPLAIVSFSMPLALGDDSSLPLLEEDTPSTSTTSSTSDTTQADVSAKKEEEKKNEENQKRDLVEVPKAMEESSDSQTASGTTELDPEMDVLSKGGGSTFADQKEFIPTYQKKRPTAAFQPNISMSAYPNAKLQNLSFNSPPQFRAFGFQAEYQPEFIQAIGVFSFGASLTYYPVNKALKDSSLINFGWGGQARYQAVFFRNQILVPFVGYSGEVFNYAVVNNEGDPPYNPATGYLLVTGPVFGGMLLLNVLEEEAAGSMYTNYGICRTYLFGEYRRTKSSLTSSVAQYLRLDGDSLFLGLRFER
jgi:hypothetical protein